MSKNASKVSMNQSPFVAGGDLHHSHSTINDNDMSIEDAPFSNDTRQGKFHLLILTIFHLYRRRSVDQELKTRYGSREVVESDIF